MSTLAEKARRMANGENAPEPTAPPADVAPPMQSEPLPEVNIPEPPEGGPEQVPVHIAWSRVMGDVRAVAKDARVESGPARFNYRGVDDALNVFGPVCRLHGVLVLPVNVEASYRDTKTSKGNPARECTVVVTYRIVGPDGGHMEVMAAGESLDSGDKGSAKAQAVALRTLLFHAGLVPTRDVDPDARNIERGEAAVRSPVSYLDEIADVNTSRARLLQIKYELNQTRQADALVTNETGDQEPIVKMIDRLGLERFGG